MTRSPCKDSRRVLVVDDDPDILEVLGMILGSAGYEVLTASDGAQALALMSGGAPPSLILLDMMMPTMNGWQFRAAQARDPSLAAAPVLVLTGDGRAAEKAADIRAAGYLKKPVDLAVLLDAVRRYC